MLIGIASTAMTHAQLVTTESKPLSLDFVNTSAAISFNPFNPNLGILNASTLSYELTLRHDWAVWNATPDAASADYQAMLSAASLLLSTQLVLFPDLDYGTGTTPTLGSTSLLTFASEFISARTEFIAGGDPQFPSGFAVRRTVTVSGSFAIPPEFGGSVQVIFDPGVWSINAANTFSASFVGVAGTLTTQYTFTPVPEPALVGALGTSALGLAVVLRRRGKRPS